MNEVDCLTQQTKALQEQLSVAEDTIHRLKKREKELKERITSNLQQHIARGGKFENVSQGTRPSHIVEQYGLLYTQGRVDALDDLDNISGLSRYEKHDEMKQKILYGIMIASYKVSYEYLKKVKENIRCQLCIPEHFESNVNEPVYREALNFLDSYLQSTTQIFDTDMIAKGVLAQMDELLPEFPILTQLNGISAYATQCCQLAWGMVNQTPPMVLEHGSEKFSTVMHTRFHASNEKNSRIKMYLWPTLVDGENFNILYRGVVWT